MTIHDELRAAGLPPLTRDAWVEVDVEALRWNVGRLRDLVGPGPRLGVVVKGDAYGHGIERAAAAFADAGADPLLVATLDEALRLRESGIATSVLIMGHVPPDGLADAARAGCAVTLGDIAGVRDAAEAWRSIAATAPSLLLDVHLEIESGMTRGGVAPEHVVASLRALQAELGIAVRGVWSHLASPESDETTDVQGARFKDALARVAAIGSTPLTRHLATSDPILLRRAGGFDLVRVGVAAYGIVDGAALQVAAGDPDLRPALSLHARCVRVAEISAGTSVGYGGEWTAARTSRIATLAVGYGDGFARAAWPGTVALVRGRRVPLVGRVSMDAITFDVTDVSGVGAGERFTLIGEQGEDRIGANELAAIRRTISREVLTALGPRLPRVYRSSGAISALRQPWGPVVEAAPTRPGTG